MSIRQTNVTMLTRAAMALGPLRHDVAFLGGATVALLLTDPAVAEVRATLDVDVILEVATRADYYAMEETLQSLGFQHDTAEGAPICRWRHGELVLDVMPTRAGILGFANTWYAEALITAHSYPLASNLDIRLVTAPAFLATKFEAFRGRGNGDYLLSHDMEDIVTVLDGCPDLADRATRHSDTMQTYLAAEAAGLLDNKAFHEALSGLMSPDSASQRRIPLIRERLARLAALRP